MNGPPKTLEQIVLEFADFGIERRYAMVIGSDIAQLIHAERIAAMTECLGIASRHAGADFVERDIRERLESIEAKAT